MKGLRITSIAGISGYDYGHVGKDPVCWLGFQN